MAGSSLARPAFGPGHTTEPTPTVSVVVCAYADRRWAALVEAMASVAGQHRAPDQVVLVIDHNPELLARAQAAFPGVTVLANSRSRGLSGARNTGVDAATGDVVAFLDDDARAREDWLSELTRAYADHRVVGTGGLVEPRWAAGTPARWLPPEFYWTVGCSYTGLPTEVAEIRNPIGANMSFRRSAIKASGGFREGVGRLDTTPLGCEETEMAVRATSALPGSVVLQTPAARVDHLVEPDRARWRYFRSRCWAEGISKAIVARHVGRHQGLSSERAYVLRVLPRGVLAGLVAPLRGDWRGPLRSAAILAGLAVTAAGYAAGKLMRSSGAELESQSRRAHVLPAAEPAPEAAA